MCRASSPPRPGDRPGRTRKTGARDQTPGGPVRCSAAPAIAIRPQRIASPTSSPAELLRPGSPRHASRSGSPGRLPGGTSLKHQPWIRRVPFRNASCPPSHRPSHGPRSIRRRHLGPGAPSADVATDRQGPRRHPPRPIRRTCRRSPFEHEVTVVDRPFDPEEIGQRHRGITYLEWPAGLLGRRQRRQRRGPEAVGRNGQTRSSRHWS